MKKVTSKYSKTYPKSIRLKSVKVIDALFRHRFFLTEGNIRLFSVPVDVSTSEPFQIMTAVPKRWLPRAVDRNRVKRLLREAARQHLGILRQSNFILEQPTAFALQYNSRKIPDFLQVNNAVEKLFNRYLQRHEIHQSDTDIHPSGAS